MRFQTIAWTLSTTLLVGCATNTDDPSTIYVPPNAGLHQPGHGYIPGGIADLGGEFTFTGPTAPGSASFVNALVNGSEADDLNGTGAMDITISGTDYASTDFNTATLMVADTDGDNDVVLAGYYLYPGTGGATNAASVYVIVKNSDFALNTPIALDGVDRVAVFQAGDATDPQPSIAGAAISGTVTFTSGALVLGTPVSGTLTGDFGPIDPSDVGGGSGSGMGTGAIVAGAYNLAYSGPAEVDCYGALVGHEADFAGIALSDLGLANGAVTVATPSTTAATIDGAVIGSAFGTTPFELDTSTDQPPGVYLGTTNTVGANGPDSTQAVGKYLAFDGADATATYINASAGVAYATTDQSSGCTISYLASLTAP